MGQREEESPARDPRRKTAGATGEGRGGGGAEAPRPVEPAARSRKPARAAPVTSTSLTSLRQPTAVVDQRGRGVVLIVDSKASQAEASADLLDSVGFRCDIASSSEAALETLRRNHYDVVLTDVVGDVEIDDFIRRMHEASPFVVVIVLSELASVEGAVRCLRAGAADYLERPIADERLLERIQQSLESRRVFELEREKRRLTVNGSPFAFEGIIYESEKMHRVLSLCAQVADTDASVLITGESGTGKDLIAKAIHRNSSRKAHRFLPVNCAALSPTIIESELFGHERGAFTGAATQRRGYFEFCHRGTIFLDEVGDIPLETQVKLLRVLENRVITRVGSNETIPIDVRVISATHRDLEARVEEGKFREDLYYRLKVVSIHLPALRERTQDIPALAAYFIRHYADVYDKSFTNIQADALAALLSHPWKGNVRELKHTIESLIVVAPGPVITLADLPEHVRPARRLASRPGAAFDSLIGMSLRDVEAELIRRTLEQVDGNRVEAARILGMGERTLYRKLKRYGLG